MVPGLFHRGDLVCLRRSGDRIWTDAVVKFATKKNYFLVVYVEGTWFGFLPLVLEDYCEEGGGWLFSGDHYELEFRLHEF